MSRTHKLNLGALVPKLKGETMRDTDWRPSPCPVCGHMRKAAENPVCRNPTCHLTEEPLVPPNRNGMERVECYKTPDGKIHEDKGDAVSWMIMKAFNEAKLTSLEGVAQDLTSNPKLRKEVMALLKELG